MKLKVILSLLIVLLSHLSLAQSYPTQRIEGKDTVVVMTIKQAQDINNVFASQKSEISKLNQDLQGMRSVADSLATDLIRTKVTLNRTQQNLIVNELKTQRMLNRQAQFFFGFWTVFITYLELSK